MTFPWRRDCSSSYGQLGERQRFIILPAGGPVQRLCAQSWRLRSARLLMTTAGPESPAPGGLEGRAAGSD
jgi:hypothetical protein